MEPPLIIRQLLLAKLKQTGCWKSYNENYRYYLFLLESSKKNYILSQTDVIEKPRTESFDNLSNDCTE